MTIFRILICLGAHIHVFGQYPPPTKVDELFLNSTQMTPLRDVDQTRKSFETVSKSQNLFRALHWQRKFFFTFVFRSNRQQPRRPC